MLWYLAVLLANPGREISALELATGLTMSDHRPSPATDAAATATFDAAALSDLSDEAVVGYRRRLEALQAEIERCDRAGDQSGAIRAHAECDLLLARLRAANGLTDRSGKSISEERARVSVGKAIRRALRHITEADPEVGELVSSTVWTGRRCAYIPLHA